eukprot:5393221-Amphidinium_carterae.1
MEVFAFREDVTENADISSTMCTTWPFVSLGFGYAGTIDERAALCHAMICLHYPHWSRRGVRCCGLQGLLG